MTARQVFEAVLVEMNKVQAPSLLLEDFNYLFNKAINQYINKRYNIYDVNQQTTDDLRVLKSSVTLRASNDKNITNDVTVRDSMYGAVYEFALPADYLHLLNCICNFRVNKPFKCYNANTYVQFPATRLTADLWSQIITNFYMHPSYKRPYYYIHNVNTYPSDSRWGSQPSGGNIGDKVNYTGNSGRVPSENIYIPTDGGNTDIQNLISLTSVTDRFNGDYIDGNNHYGYEQQYGIPRFLDFSIIQTDNDNNNQFIWRRTGRGKIFTEYNGKKLILGDVNFVPKLDENGDFCSYNEQDPTNDVNGTIKVTFNSSVVKSIGSKVIEKIQSGEANIKLVDSNSQSSGAGQTSAAQTTVAQTTPVTQNNSNGLNIPAELVDEPSSTTTTTTSSDNILTTLQYVDENGKYVIVGYDSNPIEVEWEWVPLLKHTKFNSVEKVGEVRYANPSTVRLEIRYGKDNSLFTLDSVYVDYIKSPQYIRITQEQLDLTEDTSQIMEFPDYVIQEIINELVHIVMENSADPRLQSHIPISQSVAQPAQQQEAPQTQSRRR